MMNHDYKRWGLQEERLPLRIHSAGRREIGFHNYFLLAFPSITFDHLVPSSDIS
jgi:hypothetical protein